MATANGGRHCANHIHSTKTVITTTVDTETDGRKSKSVNEKLDTFMLCVLLFSFCIQFVFRDDEDNSLFQAHSTTGHVVIVMYGIHMYNQIRNLTAYDAFGEQQQHAI